MMTIPPNVQEMKENIYTLTRKGSRFGEGIFQ